ncbi:MAG TPA: DUF1127 domain-containing protein [Casimicrobiaceae bacterium]|nr:DUF1127 domain-containing protein [Casimicrobiaceae bacterium]
MKSPFVFEKTAAPAPPLPRTPQIVPLRQPSTPTPPAKRDAPALGGSGVPGSARDTSPADATPSEWPTSHELYLSARRHQAFVLGELLSTLVRRIGAAVRALGKRYERQRRAAAAREALRELDDRTLHDLGIDRSEIASVTAEAMGEAERSRVLRRRIAPGAPAPR